MRRNLRKHLLNKKNQKQLIKQKESQRERSLSKYSQCSALYLTLENLQNDLQIRSVPTTL